MTQKIKLSKPTYNAITETDPDNLVYSSDYDTLKYSTLGSTSLTVDLSNYYHSEAGPDGTIYFNRAVKEITHGLTFTPFTTIYFENTLGGGEVTQLPFHFADFYLFMYIQAYVDSTKIYIVHYSNTTASSGSVTQNFIYRIYRNDLGL